MARSTSHIFNPQTWGTGANRYTVVTCSNPRIQYGDTGWWLNVNTIRIRAASGGRDFDSLHFDVLATIDDNVKQLAI